MRYPALLQDLQEQLAEIRHGFLRLATKDGTICPAEAALDAQIRAAEGLAERADNARLDVISMLDHGQLRPQRLRRRRELTRDLGDNDPQAA